MGGEERITITNIAYFAKDSYPENMFRNMIINAPFIARTTYNIFKYVLDEGSRVKISVSGANFKKNLQEHIRDEWIPD